MGGFEITRVEWVSTHALAVQFTSTYGSTYLYQLYAGRTRIGVSADVTSRLVVGQLKPSLWPQHITLLAVDPADRLTDFGDDLPLRPYNRVRLQFTVSSYPSDAKILEVSAGTAPAGAVDISNVIAKEFFDEDREYTITTPPLAGSGQWNFEIAGRDNRPPAGNRGTALTASATIVAHPPDLTSSGGNRFAVAIEEQQATLTFTLPV